MNDSSITRRDTLAHLAAGSAALLFGGCSQAAQSRPGESDEAFLERLLQGAAPRIPKRAEPYRIARTLVLPAGRPVRVEPGTRFRWAGPPGARDARLGVFRAGGGGCGLSVDGQGTATIEAAAPAPYVYAVVMEGQDGLVVQGIQTIDCHHVWVANRQGYGGVRTAGPQANIARNVRIEGGGSRFARFPGDTHGSCLLEYVADASVRGATYENVGHGVQWWGGNANPVAGQGDGAPGNERKCRGVVVERVTVRNCVGGIWGSMGRDIAVRDCTVENAQDVGFDAEGCQRATFERCTARNARNGCFATFYFCDAVRFVNCIGSVDNRGWPLLRVYNSTLDNTHNQGLEIAGGRFECRDRAGPGVMDTAAGPVRSLSIVDATLTNVRIDVAHHNMHRTRIAGNRLDFPWPIAALPAIRAGASKAVATPQGPQAGGVTIENNDIRYTATPAGGAAPVAIEVREDDFNSSAEGRIAGNVVRGPFRTALVLANASTNPGIRPSFSVTANRFEGSAATGPLLRIERGPQAARDPDVRWDERQTLDGRARGLAQALRGGN